MFLKKHLILNFNLTFMDNKLEVAKFRAHNLHSPIFFFVSLFLLEQFFILILFLICLFRNLHLNANNYSIDI